MAVLFDILTQVRADIQSLNLSGLSPAAILIQKVVSVKVVDLSLPEGQRFPCVLIAPWGREGNVAASNLRDDVTYPVAVCIIASESGEQKQPREKQEQNFDQYLGWRQSIRRAFSNQRLTTTLCHNVVVQPLDITDRAAWEEKGLWVSALLLQCTNREARA